MDVRLEIAKKEFRLLFKSTRRILLLGMIPLLILIIGFGAGILTVYSSPSASSHNTNVLIIQNDKGLNDTFNWGSIYYSMLKSNNLTKSFSYTNESVTSLDTLLHKNNFSVLIYIPANFSTVINQTRLAQIYVYYDNSKTSNTDAVGSIRVVTAILNQQLLYLEYHGPITFSRVSLDATGTSKGVGALLASVSVVIPLYLIMFLVLPPIALVLISVTIEREQKTLETVLLQPIERKDFIEGKILYGILIVLLNSFLSIGAILILIAGFFVLLSPNQINKIGPLIQSILNNSLLSQNQVLSLIVYFLVGLIIISILLVVIAVFFSLMARDEREANMVINLMLVVPIIAIILLVYLPLGSLPDIVILILGAIPVFGYLFSFYFIMLEGTITLISWSSLIFQVIWIFLIIRFADRLIESEGILQISFRKILRFWDKKKY